MGSELDRWWADSSCLQNRVLRMTGADDGFRRRLQAIQIKGFALLSFHIQTSRFMLYFLVLPCHRDNYVVCCVNATKNLRLGAHQVKVNQKAPSTIALHTLCVWYMTRSRRPLRSSSVNFFTHLGMSATSERLCSLQTFSTAAFSANECSSWHDSATLTKRACACSFRSADASEEGLSN